MKKIIYPVDSITLNRNNLFGANPDLYRQFGMNGHNGLDFSVVSKTPVKAVYDGEVIAVGYDEKGYGHHVRINHEGFQTIYAHGYESVGFEVGAKIKQGDIILKSGNTGFSTGPHLHFGLREIDAQGRVLKYDNGYYGYINPLLWLDATEELKIPKWSQEGVDWAIEHKIIDSFESVMETVPPEAFKYTLAVMLQRYDQYRFNS